MRVRRYSDSLAGLGRVNLVLVVEAAQQMADGHAHGDPQCQVNKTPTQVGRHVDTQSRRKAGQKTPKQARTKADESAGRQADKHTGR